MVKKFSLVIAIFLAGVFTVSVFAQKERSKIKRAKRPTFSADDKDSYFKNIFKDGLVGPRPKNLAASPKSSASGSSGGGDSTSSNESAESYAWSSIISATAIEDEVKSIKIKLEEPLKSQTKFNGGGFKQSRLNYSMLAMLFAIISEYDGDVRFKKFAHGARDAFARCAANSSTSTPQSFKQAKERKLDLQEILSGGKVDFGNKAEPKTDWSNVCDRTPLMQRLETSAFERLKPFTSSATEFSSNIDEIEQEANIVAAIAEVLSREGMEDSIEEDYTVHAVKMKEGALAILKAIENDDHEAASKAVGVITLSCDSCHEDWQ